MKRKITSSLLMVAATVVFMTLSPLAAKAEVRLFVANLSAANEVPPIANAESGVTGTAQITLDVTRDGSNNITAATARFDVQLAGFPQSTVVILSHIHEGAAGVNGPARVDSGLTPATAITLTNVGGFFSRSGLPVTPAIAAGIIANPAGWYFNVHSVLNTGGVARGQLVVQAAGPSASAPTLSEWGAVLMTLLVLAAGIFFPSGRRQATLTGEGASLTVSDPRTINWRLLARLTIYVEAVVALALLALRAGPVDAMGALTSGIVVAFILHLLLGSMRKR